MSNRRVSLLPSIVFGIVVGVAIATVFFHSSDTATPPATVPTAVMPAMAPVSAEPEQATLLEDERNTIQVFEHVSPAVVFITNKALRRDFFTMDVQEVPQGAGSGFIWDAEGHIVTNYHVIEGGNSWSVTLNDNTSYDAEFVGAEPSKDLAVMRIKAPRSTLTPLPAASSDNLRVGQKVVAVGNPFGLDQTLTTGVVSALGREIRASNGRTIQGVIQTDAAINPGNSGGPLMNSRGELIGINTAIYSTSGASAGIGFAVPVSIVRRLVPQLIQYGKITRPGLGISLVDDSIARRLGVDGVIIYRVARGSAAHRAGLKGLTETDWGRVEVGDVIVGINGQTVTTYDDLGTELEKYQVGETINVKILRNKREMAVRVQLQEVE
jgi:S1-C subfamily serine protease